jgi:hypothetical protein
MAVRFAEGYAAGAPILKEALGAFRRETVLPAQEGRWLLPACWTAADLWGDDTWRLLAARELERVRQSGALTATGLVLGRSATCMPFRRSSGGGVVAGRGADRHWSTGIAPYPYARLWVAALRCVVGRRSLLS